MPWYRFHAIHGPGHQSTTEWYKWYNYSLTNYDLDDVIGHYCNANYLRNYIAVMRLVHKLPANVHANMLKGAVSNVKGARRALKAVKDTEILKRKPRAIQH